MDKEINEEVHNYINNFNDFFNLKKQIQKNEDLQNRIEKAVEYIKTNIEDEYKWDGLLYENKEKKKLLDILKGVDKE